MQRALVTVTSSGTTFLTLARARPALGAPSPSPFVSPSLSAYSQVFRSSSWPGEKDTNDVRGSVQRFAVFHDPIWNCARRKRARLEEVVRKSVASHVNAVRFVRLILMTLSAGRQVFHVGFFPDNPRLLRAAVQRVLFPRGTMPQRGEEFTEREIDRGGLDASLVAGSHVSAQQEGD